MRLGRLKKACKAERNEIARKRMQVVISVQTKLNMLGVNKTTAYKVTAAEEQISVTAVRDYVRRYKKDGVAGMYNRPIRGRPRIYDPKLVRASYELLKNNNGGRVTPRLLMLKVAEKDGSGRVMSIRQARRLLREMGMTPKKAERTDVAAAPPREVYYWLRVTLPIILELRKHGYTVAVEDEMVVSQDANGKQIYWSPPGVTVKVPYIGDHDNCVALGLTTEPDENGVARHCNIMEKSANTDNFIKLLEKAESEYGLIVVIVDRAGWHHSKKLKTFLASREGRIVVFQLPKGSAYKSVQEANWRQTKLSEFYSEYFSSIDMKSDATQEYLDSKLNPDLNLWAYLLRSPYAYRRNIKRRKKHYGEKGPLAYIIRKYDGLKVPKLGKKYAPLFGDPDELKKDR